MAQQGKSLENEFLQMTMSITSLKHTLERDKHNHVCVSPSQKKNKKKRYTVLIIWKTIFLKVSVPLLICDFNESLIHFWVGFLFGDGGGCYKCNKLILKFM